MKLTLLLSPSEMQRHEHESIFRELFTEFSNATLKEVKEFLDSKNIKYTTEIRTNMYGSPLVGFKVNDKFVFGHSVI